MAAEKAKAKAKEVPQPRNMRGRKGIRQNRTLPGIVNDGCFRWPGRNQSKGRGTRRLRQTVLRLFAFTG